MHRHVLRIKTRILGGIDIMQLADGFDANAGFLQAMAPTLVTAFVSDGIIPAAMLMDRKPGRQTGTRRHADWRGRIGIGETRAARCQGIEMRRARQRMAGDTHQIGAMFIRQENENV